MPITSLCHRANHLSSSFFNATATTEIYTLSLHDALPIWPTTETIWPLRTSGGTSGWRARTWARLWVRETSTGYAGMAARSEEHTSELQSRRDLVCRLLLEKKKN